MSKQNNRINSEGRLGNKRSDLINLQPLKLTQGLLVVGAIRHNLTKLQAYMPQIKPTNSSTQDSHQKFVNTLQRVNQKTHFKIKQTIISTTTEANQQKKQKTKSITKIIQPLNHCAKQQTIQSKNKNNEEQNNAFVQKKMKLGKINKTNAMKQFIIDMLSKGKAQGTCLTILKGTAQCTNNLNKEFNISQISKTNRQNVPRENVNQNRIDPTIKKRCMLGIPGQRPKIPKGTTNKNSVNLPYISKNKKYVVMMKKMQKNKQKHNHIQQQIEQIIELDIKKGEKNQQTQIKQEIKQEITQ